MRRTTEQLPAIEGDFGPAMTALTPLKRAFVLAKVHGGLNNADAYRATGYVGDNAATLAHAVAHSEDVQDAILEEGRKLMRSEGPKSILTLVAIRDDRSVKPEARIKAATELLNRSGFHAIMESHQHLHTHMSEAEQDKRILALCAELGMSTDQAKKMLIAPSEFERNAQGVFELPARELSDDPAAVKKRAEKLRRRDMSAEELQADKERIRTARRDHMKRERAEAEARRAGLFDPEPTEGAEDWSDVEY